MLLVLHREVRLVIKNDWGSKCTILEQGVVLKAGVQSSCLRKKSTFNFLISEILVGLESVSKSKTIPYNYLLS